MRLLAPILLSLAVALGACGGTDDIQDNLKDFASDVREWTDAHADWSKILNTASESEVRKLISEQVAQMRKKAKAIADDVGSIDDDDIKKGLEPMTAAVDDVQAAAEDVSDALRKKSKDAYARALVAYQRIAAEAARRQQDVSEFLQKKLDEDK